MLYRDLYEPIGFGLLTMSEDPAFFTGTLRDFLRDSAIAAMEHKPKVGIFGRSYTLGSGMEPEITALPVIDGETGRIGREWLRWVVNSPRIS